MLPETPMSLSTASWFETVSCAHAPGAIEAANVPRAVLASGGGGGGGGGDPGRVNDALPPPLGPVQSRRKVLLLVNAPVDWTPEIALAPDHAPEAVQEATFVEDQTSDEDAPLGTSGGIAATDTVGPDGPGGGGAEGPCTVTVADALPVPPGPVQVRV